MSLEQSKAIVHAVESLHQGYTYQRELYSKIMQFDLNISKNPELTIAIRLARENTNDLGD